MTKRRILWLDFSSKENAKRGLLKKINISNDKREIQIISAKNITII
jgi:hypothetical protein